MISQIREELSSNSVEQPASVMDTSLLPLFGYQIVCVLFTAANAQSQLPLSGHPKWTADSPQADCTTSFLDETWLEGTNCVNK